VQQHTMIQYYEQIWIKILFHFLCVFWSQNGSIIYKLENMTDNVFYVYIYQTSLTHVLLESFKEMLCDAYTCIALLCHVLEFVEIWYIEPSLQAHSSIVGWATMLHTRRSRVQFLVRSVDFLLDLTLPAALWPWGQLSL
jgi:hypothetical protein